MTQVSTAGETFKEAFIAIANTLWAGTDIQVCFGHPGQHLADDIVSFGMVTSNSSPANFGPLRAREEVLTLGIIVSCYRGGGPEAEQIASAQAFTLLGQLENYARFTDTTIGGTVRECFLIQYVTDGATDPAIIAGGRAVEISATFQAHARITS